MFHICQDTVKLAKLVRDDVSWISIWIISMCINCMVVYFDVVKDGVNKIIHKL